MRLVYLLCATFAFLMPAVQADAQQEAWIQIEAHPDLAEATARARAYGGTVEDINGFALGGRWYAVALGPYDPAEARATLRRLREAGAIPRDSYVSDGIGYRDRFWPVGAGAVAGPQVTVREVQTANAPVSEPVEGPILDAGLPDESRSDALLSEQLLTREELMELQRGLEWLGFYDAEIDGRFGRGTRNAMATWQRSAGARDATGVLTTGQRTQVLQAFAEARRDLGLEQLRHAEAGVSLIAPLGLVAFDRIEAPFVHYAPLGDSGVSLSLISQAGDADMLAGLYEIVQTLAIVPPAGDRALEADRFRILGVAQERTTEVFARLEGGHILGYVLSWPEAQDALAARALPEMERTLVSTGAPLPTEAGFEPAAQRLDMVSGLEVRRPLREASGFFVDGTGTVLTAADTVAGCGRVTLGGRDATRVVSVRDGVAVLRPEARLAPLEVAQLAPVEGRLRSPVSVGGFPYGGVLTSATLSFGTLEDVRDLDGNGDVLRLSLSARDGDFGGPVLDPSGRVAGLLLGGAGGTGRELPADVGFALKARVLRDLLAEEGVTARVSEDTAPIAPEELAARATGMTVLVSCWE